MGRKKRRAATYLGEDRLSNLPAHLIDSILELLPFEDAVRTSIISKKWRYKWTTMKVIAFEDEFSEKFYTENGDFDCNGYISTINKVLALHKGPVSKFVAYLPNMFLESFQDIDQWMLFLSENSVKKLVFTNGNQGYVLPCCMFSCLELTELILENWLFMPPLEFKGFPNLEELFLEHIYFGDSLRETQINLPQLKNLSFLECLNVYNFNIKATNLKSLIIVTCPDANVLKLLENTSLTCFGISFRTMEGFIPAIKINPVLLLSNLTTVEDFSIEGNFLKVLFAENIPKWLPLSINSVNRLVLQDFQIGDLTQLQGALCLIRNLPNVDTLRIHLDMEYLVNERPSLDHLETPNCLDYTLKQLQAIEITCVEGTRAELLFIKLLLAHSPNLEKMSITPSGGLNIRKRFGIAKDVMRFPRASPKAEMIYLNP